jgi:two-component system cell cycle sensor histidine kinase/response regulator CckA
MVQPLSAITDPVELRLRSEMMLRMAGNLAKFGGWSLDVTTNVNFWSDELCQILGYSIGTPPKVAEAYALYPDDDRTAIGAAMAACVAEGTPIDELLNMHDARGRLLRVHVVAEAIRDGDGRVTHVEGAFHDITEQEHERAARAAIELRLSTTLDSLSDGLMIFDSDWRFTYINPRAEEMFGVRGSDVLGRSVLDIVPKRADSQLGLAMRRAAADNRRVSIREFHPRFHMWLDVTAYPSVAGLAVYLRDVTEEEEIVRDNAAKSGVISSQAALLDVARDAILVRGLDHSIRYWNRAAENMYGWTAAEALGKSVRDLVYEDSRAFDTATAAVLRDGQWFGDIEQKSRDGRRIIAEGSWTLVRDAHNRPESIFSVNRDVTNRRREDDFNLRRERMESIGTLASGIAHDLNNVLAPMLLGVQLLSSTETDPQRMALMATMESSVKRGADMIRQVLSFARGLEGKRIVVDLVRLLGDLKAFGRETLPKSVTLDMQVPNDLWPTLGDPTQLLRVLVNLITNARDAMADGGTITITAKNAELNDDYASVSHLASPGRYVAIDVEDDGSGMTPDVVDKAFEPFFTTKGSGSGTGLGLASSLAIIRAHGGYMQVYSEAGHGSRFQIYLLAASEDTAIPTPSKSGSPVELPSGRGELVLVVDDEEAIRQLTRQTLETFGYTTLGASNGADAIVVLSESDPPVDLVLTDMMMPVMDGAALAAELAISRPTLPVIAMSGLNANGGVARASKAGVSRFLPKPFTTETLVRAVGDALSDDPVPHDPADPAPHV